MPSIPSAQIDLYIIVFFMIYIGIYSQPTLQESLIIFRSCPLIHIFITVDPLNYNEGEGDASTHPRPSCEPSPKDSNRIHVAHLCTSSSSSIMTRHGIQVSMFTTAYKSHPGRTNLALSA